MPCQNLVTLLIAALMSLIALPSAFAAEPADWKIITPKWDGGNERPIQRVVCWPHKDELLASTACNGLWNSKDGGETWQRTSKPEQPLPNPLSQNNCNANCFVFDPKNADTMWTSGMYGYGAWATTDGGKTFKQFAKEPHFDGCAVDFSDPERKFLLLCPHEQHPSLLKSTDGGATWTKIGEKNPEDPDCSTKPLILDSKTILVNSYGYRKPDKWGIYRSEDAGVTWTKVSEERASSDVILTSKGDILWTVGPGLLKSSDQGKTWSLLKSPVKGQVLEVAPDRLVGLSSGGKSQPYVSKDAGNTWTPIGKPLPFKARTFTYDAARKCFLAVEELQKGQTGGVLARWDLPANVEEAFGH